MFDIGWSEIGLIAVIALVVIGPKDLPVVLRAFGRWVRKARRMAGQFQNQVDDLIREADLEDVKKDLTSAHRAMQPRNLARTLDRSIDPDGSIAASFRQTPGQILREDKPGSPLPGQTADGDAVLPPPEKP